MKVMVIGAGRSGAHALIQLKKNPRIEVIVVDPRERPYAVAEGLIDEIDIKEQLTPLNLDHIVAAVEPEIILLTRSAEDLQLGDVAGMDLLAESLRTELVAISNVPMIETVRR